MRIRQKSEIRQKPEETGNEKLSENEISTETEKSNFSHLGPTFTRREAVNIEEMRHVQPFILKEILEKAIARAIRLMSKKMFLEDEKLWRMTKEVKVEALDILDRVLFMIHEGIG